MTGLNLEQRQIVELGGNRHLAYWQWGQGPNRLLLLHGLADHGGIWASLAEQLSPNFQLIAPDLRGHGESSKPAQGYRCAEIIGDVQQLCEQLGWQDFHLLGHSWGGKLACIWATQQPNSIQSLILVDPAFIASMPGWLKITFPVLYRTLPFLKTMGPFASRDAAVALAQTLKQYRGWSAFQAQVFDYSIEPKRDGPGEGQWGSKFSPAARDGIFTEMMAVDGLTQSLTLPSLLVLPEAGLNRMAWQLQPYRKYLQNLQEIRVPGNHWPFLVAPTVFNATVQAFLADVVAI
ncbi:MAG: alpha/beta hydrolase [Cyanobacteria bacterium P01_G01_bin.54]